jgi:hypothetical protein
MRVRLSLAGIKIMGIVAIDMHIRDERVLAWLTEEAGETSLRVSSVAVAQEFKCHQNTAQAILRRLRLAGCIEVEQKSFRGGFTYRVKRETS